MRNRILVAVLLFASCFLINAQKATAITRSQVLANGVPFYQLMWYCDSANYYNAAHNYYSKFLPSNHYMGEAYCWSGWDNWSDEYIDKLNNGYTAGCINTAFSDAPSWAAGLDCSGFATRCWALPYKHRTNDFYDIAQDVDWNSIKPGDMLVMGDYHMGLFVYGTKYNASIAHSTAESPYYRVVYKENLDNWSWYYPVSIFPQFSAFKPAVGETVKIENKPFVIQLKAEGSKSIENVLMWLDGNSVTPTTSGPKNRKTIKYKYDNPTPGKHRVKVQCSNIVNGIAYDDTVAWVFRYGTPEWYECTDNRNSFRPYYLVYGTYSSLYTIYDMHQAPGTWVWTGKLRGVTTLTSLKFGGSIGEAPFWLTGDGDTTDLFWLNNQPNITPGSLGSYSITVNGNVVASVAGQHVYSTVTPPGQFSYYRNNIFYHGTSLNGLSIQNPTEVKVTFIPPGWPSPTVDTTTWAYLGSNCYVYDGRPFNLLVFNEDTMLVGYGGSLKGSSQNDVVSDEPEDGSKNVTTYSFGLSNSYPNPVRDVANIRFSIPAAGSVSLKVYNLTGQLVKTLVNDNIPAGIHSYRWDGTDENKHMVSQGVYLYRMTAGSFSATKKLIWLK